MASSVSFGDANSGLQVGNNSGSITAQIHLPPKPQEATPTPLSTIPFARDPDFVDRATLLDEVHSISSSPASRLALVGIGGVGKSQLAIEYCYRFLDESPDRWAFWIHASNAGRFQQGCQSIADRVKIPGRDDPKTSSLKLLSDWLCDKKRERWVLVLDNVDDDTFLHAITQSGEPLSAQLPTSSNGTIIITTRSKEVALRLVEDRNIINVEPMTEQDAVTLFEKKLGRQTEKEVVVELITALDLMPLAIVQAAAYIKQRAPRCTVQQYLEQFRKDDRRRTKLLDHEGGRLRRDWEAKNSILVTWHISFDYLQQTRKSAADLLSLMSFFDRQGIPECCLRKRAKAAEEDDNDSSQEVADNDSLASSTDDEELEEDIHKLQSFSFISTTSDGTTFEMHRLVQLATRNWLETHGQFNKWKQIFISNLSREFPSQTLGYENLSKSESLFPHVRLIMTHYPDLNDCLESWAELQIKASWFAVQKQHMTEAENLSKGALDLHRKLYGPEDRRTLLRLEFLGICYARGGRPQDAEASIVQVMKIQRRVLGAEHLDTLSSMSNLATVYHTQHRWHEAEALSMQAYLGRLKLLGPHHRNTLTSAMDLAGVYQGQGRWQDAEKLLMQIVDTQKTDLGTNHLDTLRSLRILATVYQDQGLYHKAESLLTQVIDTGTKVFGTDHPQSIISMSQLAILYLHQEKSSEAETVLVDVTEICKRTLGEEHTDTVGPMRLLAFVYTHLGRWQKSESLYRQLLDTCKSKHGAEDPLTLTIMHDLAISQGMLGRFTDAQSLLRTCVEIRTRLLGPDHPDTVKSVEWLKLVSTAHESLEAIKE